MVSQTIRNMLTSPVAMSICSDILVSEDTRKIYIVYMGGLPSEREYIPTSHHKSILEEVLEGSLLDDVLIHSYKKSFNGFAAKLTERESKKLLGMKGIVSVFPNKELQLHTTRSWDFMGFPETVKRMPSFESDVIIGFMDTGIWPESDSFKDDGFGPPPKKWKGICEAQKNFSCNNKIIGARSYVKIPLFDTPRDTDGHGTHVASIAAGNIVKDTSFFDLAKGNARGAVPSARIAVYKVCGPFICEEKDVLAAFDDAIADGVDILSLSLGSRFPADVEYDVVAIGAFHAVRKGILVSHSAGNGGPFPLSVSSTVPWVLTVAASTTDRQFIEKVVLGNGKTIVGTGVNGFNMNGTSFPLILGKDVSPDINVLTSSSSTIGYCYNMNGSLVSGKIVVCDEESNGEEAYRAGAAGTIMIGEIDIPDDVSYVYPLPAILLNGKYGEDIYSYVTSTKNPVGTILKSETITDSKAPVVVPFSSRGPNFIIDDIIKPDISAPGVDILAAFSPVGSPSGVKESKMSVKYSIISGTSISCPHVTGAAAYVKSFHPDWSPSAIKSALMTTAFTMSASKNDEAEFAYGAGHIDPLKAVNPGLVYETAEDEYVKMLCDIGLSSDTVKQITNHTCPEDNNGVKRSGGKDLNYPSLGALVERGKSIDLNFTRTVTNVGYANSTYTATIKSDERVKLTVKPDTLSFKFLNERKTFVVYAVGDGLNVRRATMSGEIVWSDGVHNVRSPIVVFIYP